ncbi:MAG: ATP-binding protein [Acidobacteriota bacterium]
MTGYIKNSFSPAKILIIYLMIGGLWIILSDMVHGVLANEIWSNKMIEISKGLLFVGITGLVLFLVLKQANAKQQATQKALAQAEERYRSIYENALYGIFLTTFDGRFISVNPALVDMLGYESGEALMKVKLQDIYCNPDDHKRLLEICQSQQKVQGFEVDWQNPNGKTLTVRLSAMAFYSPDDNEEILQTIAEDISERRSLEDQFRQSQKMEALGVLAGGVAHDFNNLLTTVIGYSQLILSRVDSSDPNRKHIVEIEKAGQRATSLTRQLLMFSRKQIVQPKVIDINTLLAEMGKMLRRLIGEDVELHINPKENLVNIFADPGQIEQVIMNLAVNARDAMPEGGHLTIKTYDLMITENYVKESFQVEAGRYVVLEIADTGMGMEKATLKRIFEPFFTTKDLGKGTGLGLSTVYGIVKQVNGFIEVDSECGQGTVFKIFFPVAAIQREQERQAAIRSTPQNGSGTILLVEDDVAVRELTREILEASGYTMLVANHTVEALHIAKTHPGTINLLLTDVVMPYMNGRYLADEVVKTRPDIKVLYVSGYTDDAVVLNRVLKEGLAFLQKPFLPGELMRKVRDVLKGKTNSIAS